MQRRSARVSKGAYAEGSDHDPNEMDSGDDTEFVAPAKKSRGRKRKTLDDKDTKEVAPRPAKKVRGKRGMLGRLVEMPLDILFEIFGQLEPLDLVHIARTTKALRAILMNRSSISVWRTARSNIDGLPNCPNDLTEPQYATLVFGKSCSFCHRNLSIVHVSWVSRVRCCNKCLEANFEPIRMTRMYWIGTRDYPSLLASWAPCLKIIRHTTRKAGLATHETWYCLRKVDRQWRSQYTALASPQSKSEWLHQQLEERYAIQKHGRECERWYARYHDMFDTPLDWLIAERKIEVLEYIKELGFEEELYKLHPMVDPHPIDDVSVEEVCRQPITETTLLTLKHRLTARMNEYQNQREYLEHQQFLEARKPLLLEIHTKGIQNLPINAVHPNLCELHQIAEEHELIDYSKSTSDALRVPFSAVVALWKSNVEGQLIDLMEQACGPDHVFDKTTVFDLATTFFDCSLCYHAISMRHERAMMHQCATQPRWASDENTPQQRASHFVFKQVAWNSGNRDAVKFSKDEWITMSEVVTMVGLNPQTTTAKEMDERDPIFECRTCNAIDEGRATMTWAAVGDHKRTRHKDAVQPMILQILDDPHASKVRERIKEEQARATHKDPCKILCPHCRTMSGNMGIYRRHLKDKHELTKVKDDELIFALDQNRIPPMYRLWPPRDDVLDSDDEA